MKMRAMQEEASVPSYGYNTRSPRTATQLRTVDMVNYNAEDLPSHDQALTVY
jgi:hypothetical protein